jgi:hypothetical protein
MSWRNWVEGRRAVTRPIPRRRTYNRRSMVHTMHPAKYLTSTLYSKLTTKATSIIQHSNFHPTYTSEKYSCKGPILKISATNFSPASVTKLSELSSGMQ